MKKKEKTKLSFSNTGNVLLGDHKLIDVQADKKGFKQLCKAIATNEVPPSLNLGNLEISDTEAKPLAEALKKNTNLVSLNLSHNKIADKGMEHICKALENHPSLNTLNLERNAAKNSLPLAQLIQKTPKITTLNISWGKYNLENIRILCGALGVNKTIQTLIFHHSNLDVKGNWELCHMLKSNSTIECLDISSNQIGNDGFQLLCKILENNKNIHVLNIDGNGINLDEKGSNGFVCDMLRKNKALTELYLSGSTHHSNYMDFDKPFLKAVGSNTNLLVLQVHKLAQPVIDPYLNRNKEIAKQKALATKLPILGGPKKGTEFISLMSATTNKKGEIEFSSVKGGLHKPIVSIIGKHLGTDDFYQNMQHMFNSKHWKNLSEKQKESAFKVINSLLPLKNTNYKSAFNDLDDYAKNLAAHPSLTYNFDTFLSRFTEALQKTDKENPLCTYTSMPKTMLLIAKRREQTSCFPEEGVYLFTTDKGNPVALTDKTFLGVRNGGMKEGRKFVELSEKKGEFTVTKNERNEEKRITIPHALKNTPVCGMYKLTENKEKFTKGKQVKDLQDKPILFNLKTGKREQEVKQQRN